MLTGRRGGGGGSAGVGSVPGAADGGAPGRRTLTQHLPVQRKVAAGPGDGGSSAPTTPAASDVDREEHVVLLSTSTTDSRVGADRALFQPRKRYELSLGLMSFYRLGPNGHGGFADAAGAATDWNESDYFEAGGAPIAGGPKPYPAVSTTFAITAHQDEHRRWVDDEPVTVRAANNGMLNLARLSSAFISASAGGALATSKQRLRLLCTVTMGNDVGGADADARHERYLSTTPPSFVPQADFSAQAVMTALLGAWGYADKVPWVRAWAQAHSVPASATAADYGAAAERIISDRWSFRADSQLIAVTTPLTGIATAITAAAGARGHGAGAAYGKADDFRTYDQTLYADVSRATIAVDDVVAAQVKAAQAAWFATELPAELTPLRATMLADWSAAVDAGFAGSRIAKDGVPTEALRVDLYQRNFLSADTPVATTQGGGAVADGTAGSDEGDIVNPLRIHDGDRDPVRR